MSDEKVQMLVEGLPERWRDKFDLKATLGLPVQTGVPASVEISHRHLDEGRFKRAERLCAALREEGRVGDLLSEGTEFIAGEMMMTWGFWNRWQGGYADVVGFGGFPEAGVSIFLGGSAYFTLERAADRLQQYSNSGLQQLMQFLFERHGKASEGRTALPGAWYAETWDADRDNPLASVFHGTLGTAE